MANIRKVKKGKAKDYERDAKYYDYYYITVNNKDYTLNYAGWNRETTIQNDKEGQFVIIEDKKYYLEF
jgi:hypothetical protein